MKKKTCARAETAPSKGDASARAPRASASSAAVCSLDGAAEVDHVNHVVENMRLSMIRSRACAHCRARR